MGYVIKINTDFMKRGFKGENLRVKVFACAYLTLKSSAASLALSIWRMILALSWLAIQIWRQTDEELRLKCSLWR